MWSVINKVIKKSKSVSNCPDSFCHNENMVIDKNEIVDKFNDIFVNVGPNLAKNIKVGNKNIDVLQYMNNRNQLSMFLESKMKLKLKKL